MIIPFTKAHGARNDFLLTWSDQAPHKNHREIAIAICDRHTGAGADGWMLVQPPDEEAYASIRLFNSDGSEAEISGNGTRCAAAFLVAGGHAKRDVPIVTGAGLKHLRMMEREENHFVFEMNMGTPRVVQMKQDIGGRHATILDVGNPQCAFFVDDFDFDWASVGAAVERHPYFPNRTNVSFIRAIDRHTIEVRFYERGAGVTMSSGTGSTGAAAAARAHGLVDGPVTVLTPAGPLALQWDEGTVHLVGPADIVVRGEFFCDL